MMKPPKERLKEDECDPVPLTEAEITSMTDFYSFYQNRDLAQIMLDHDFLPPTPKDKEGNKQWQIDEMALRLEYCKATRINIVFANKLNKIQNSYSPPADVHSMYFGQKHPQAEFEVLESSNERCKLRCRLHPKMGWIPVTFDIIDAQDQKLIKEKSVHWKGNGIQNMLAKNCRIKAENILDRSFVGNSPVEYNEEDNSSTQQIEEEIKTQIVSFSPTPESKPAFTQPIIESITEPIIQEVFEVVELEPDSAMELETNEKEIEASIKTDMPSAEELKAIRDQKISELPPTADAPLEILEEPVNMLAREEILEPPKEPESKRKQKKTTKAVIKEQKPDTAFLDKTPLKETPIEPLRKPFPMTELAVTDPKYHTKEIYDMIGDDWFMAFKKEDMQSNLWLDANFTIYQSIVQKYDESLIPKVTQKYEEFYQQANPSEKLIVLYRDALIGMENPPPMNILDTKYLEKMVFIVGLLKTFKPSKTDPDSKREEFFQWFTEKNQGNNKEALWGYKYMQARGLI